MNGSFHLKRFYYWEYSMLLYCGASSVSISSGTSNFFHLLQLEKLTARKMTGFYMIVNILGLSLTNCAQSISKATCDVMPISFHSPFNLRRVKTCHFSCMLKHNLVFSRWTLSYIKLWLKINFANLFNLSYDVINGMKKKDLVDYIIDCQKCQLKPSK